METRTFTIRIDAGLYSVLKALAEREDRSVSWLCGRAIGEYLARPRLAVKRPRKPRKPPGFLG
jgi:predicted transcriptional regulator